MLIEANVLPSGVYKRANGGSVRVLITGGTGFIGSRLALRCLALGHTVTVLAQENNPVEARNRQQIEAKGARIILGSVTDRERVSEAVREIDWIYHLAAAQHEANVSDEKFWRVNVEGTTNVLRASTAALESNASFTEVRLAYTASSTAEIDEQSPSRPDNIYGVTKLEAEKLVLTYREKATGRCNSHRRDLRAWGLPTPQALQGHSKGHIFYGRQWGQSTSSTLYR